MPLDSTAGPVSQALLGQKSTIPTGAGGAPALVATGPRSAPAPAPPVSGPEPLPGPTHVVQPQPTSGVNEVTPDTLPDLASALKQSVDALSDEESDPGPNPPPAPYMPPPPTNKPFDPVKTWGSTAMVLAAIGSAFTRRPMVAALNAGAAVMNAYKQNDTDAANTAMATWHAETANALAVQKYQMDQYTKILNQKNVSIREKLSAVSAQAAALRDAPTIAALQTGGLPAVIALNKKRGTTAVSLADTSFDVSTNHIATQGDDKPDSSGYSKNDWVNMANAFLGGDKTAKPEFATGKLGDLQKEEWNKAMMQVRAKIPAGTASGGALSQTSVAALGRAFYLGTPMSQLTAGLGPEASSVRAEITNYAINYAISIGKDPTTFMVNEANYKANEETLNAMNKTASNAAAYEQNTLQNMNTAEGLMKTGIPTNISPILNQIAAYGEVKVGSPQTLAYGAALVTVLSEYAKVMAGGTGSSAATSDSARQEAHDLLPQFGTQAQAEAVFGVMRQDMSNRIKTYSNSINVIDQAIQTGKIASGVDTTPPPPAYTPAPTTPAPAPTTAQTPSAPPIGTIEQGYKFNGGNPGDPTNWSKV